MYKIVGMLGLFTALISVVMLVISMIRKTNNKKKLTKILVAGFTVFFLALLLEPIPDSQATAKEQTSNTINELDLNEFKNESITIEYKDLARNPQNYIGQKVNYTGEVVQVMEKGTDVQLRVNVTKTDWGYEDTIYVTYNRSEGEGRILEDDVINLWGICDDLVTYETVLGDEISIPKVDAVIIELVTEEDNNDVQENSDAENLNENQEVVNSEKEVTPVKEEISIEKDTVLNKTLCICGINYVEDNTEWIGEDKCDTCIKNIIWSHADNYACQVCEVKTSTLCPYDQCAPVCDFHTGYYCDCGEFHHPEVLCPIFD